MSHLSKLSLLVAVIVGSSASAQKVWPHWRGPDRTGISTESGWSDKGKSESVWKKNVGLGYSTVSIADGKLYTIGHDKDEQKDTVFCLDAETGEEKWTHSFDSRTMAKYHGGGSLTTPTIDGDRIYVSNREGKFFCLDAKSGKVKWKKNLRKDFGVKLPIWGLSASPLVLDDMVIMNVNRVVAFDKKGKVKWKTKDYGHAYSTPAPCKVAQKDALAVFNGKGLILMDQKNGKEIASHEWQTKYDVNASTPTVIGDNRFFVSSGYNKGCAMMKLDGKKLKILWEGKQMRTHMSGCVLFKDHLYGFDESTVRCLDLDGEVQWSKRLGKGALVLADGKLLMMSAKGHLLVAEATHEEFKELSRDQVLTGGRYWTTPVLCNGLVYCRNSNGDLVCRDHRGDSK